MKQLLLLAVASIAFLVQANAQCPTHVKYSASKMEIVDASGAVLETKDESLSFETYEKGFTGIRLEDVSDSLHGTLKSVTCDWKEPYKNGKIVMVCDVQGGNEDMQDATITIEAVNGKITITLNAKEHGDKLIRLVVDKYEELK